MSHDEKEDSNDGSGHGKESPPLVSSPKRKGEDGKSEATRPPFRLNHRLFTIPTASASKKKRSKKKRGSSSNSDDEYFREKVAKGSIASLVLERIGKARPIDILPQSSDDEEMDRNAAEPLASAGNGGTPKNGSALEDTLPLGFSSLQTFWSDEGSSDESSSVEPKPRCTIPSQVSTHVVFRSTVRPQGRPGETLPKKRPPTMPSPPKATENHQPQISKEAPTDILTGEAERDIDQLSEPQAEKNATESTRKRVLAGVSEQEIKKTFLASLGRTFHVSIQTATSDLLRARLKATATPSSQVTDPSPANAPPGGATNWQEHCVAKDKELKDILLASSRARSLAGQVFNRMEELSSTKERQTGDVFASSEGNV